ncbi:NAD(P)-binding protein [Armillaria gallica]|uniref:NAD(P)-binding protein n=1 Tax=Armillaria gallica TaxID=47427 RepID=A0A2H3EAU5_ARMGA|nr:NAD(P)-binding protein [Armillaria gallica]
MRLINQFLGSTMTSNASKIIFVRLFLADDYQGVISLFKVTGGTGFIGFHVLVQLLQAGYTVRATARGKKAHLLRNALGTTYDKLQVLEIPDIFSDDLSEALQGVYGIVHLASTTPGKADAATSYRLATEGSRHILREYPPGGPYGVDDWFSMTQEEVTATNNPFLICRGSKTAADQAMLEFSKDYPELDLSFVAPHYTFGPLAPGFEHMLPEPEYKAFSTNGFIYALLLPNNVHFAVFPGVIDVRDIARAHLLALESPPTSAVGRKRSPLVSPYQSSYKEAIEIIAKERPELKDRLVHPLKAPEWPSYTFEVDREVVEKQIGLKADSYIPWRDTVLDAVDSLVRIENIWKAKGFKVAVPDTPPL